MDKAKMKYWILLVIIFFGINNSSAKDDPANWTITGSAGGAWNIHTASFPRLPGLETCCTEFTGGSGIGWYAEAGAEYRLDGGLFGRPASLYLRGGIAGLSADLIEEEFIGHVISGNEAGRALVEYRIYPELSALMFSPGIKIRPLDELPLSIRFGGRIGIYMSQSFESEEALISPDDVTFENGERFRRQRSGELPDASGLYAAISVGAEFDAWQSGNWLVRPELMFDYSLTNVVSPIDWKANALRGGVTVAYVIPAPEAPAPKPAPLPGMPEPPVPPVIHPASVDLKLMANGREIGQGDTIRIDAEYKYEITKMSLRPAVFYVPGKTAPADYSIEFMNGKIDQRNVIDAVANYLKSNDKPAGMVAHITSAETRQTAEERIEMIADNLSELGIDTGRIQSEIVVHDTAGFKRPELAAEHSRIEFRFDGARALDYITREDLSETIRETELVISADIDSKATIMRRRTTAYLGGLQILDAADTYAKFKLGRDIDRDGDYLQVNSYALNSDNQTGADSIGAYVRIHIDKRDTSVNRLGEENIFILGFFEFDGSEFTGVNRSALEAVRKSADAGRSIELVGLTDDFGSESYNNSLARRRMQAASELIARPDAELKFIQPDQYWFSNNNPMGRFYNRSVIVRIK